MHETLHSKPVHWDNPEGWGGEEGGRGVQYSDIHPIYQYAQISCDSVYTVRFDNFSTHREIRPSANAGLADTITYPVQYVEWDFGDGSPRSATLSPTHNYAELGYYPVTLWVYDRHHNCRDSVTHMVFVDTVNHVNVESSTPRRK